MSKTDLNTKLYQLTIRPKLFKDTYWGNFHEDGLGDAAEVINNRNKFVTEFGIVRHDRSPPQYKERIINQLKEIIHMDHLEYYYTDRKTHIVINNPYIIPSTCEKYDDVVKLSEENGFKLYDPLYSLIASTFLMEIPNKKPCK